jgi:hypothetical protein
MTNQAETAFSSFLRSNRHQLTAFIDGSFSSVPSGDEGIVASHHPLLILQVDIPLLYLRGIAANFGVPADKASDDPSNLVLLFL